MRVAEKESDIQRTILDGLAAMKIWHMRMNTGGMFGVHKGKRWAVRFGRKGMADILVVKSHHLDGLFHTPVWIECKRPGEKQSPDQIEFQAEVEAEGHLYAVVHSWEEALEVLKT